MKKSLKYARQDEFMSYYEYVKTQLSRFARTLTRNNEEARDLVSDTILVAYKNFDKIKNRQAFTSYIFTIATRIHRKQKANRTRLVEESRPCQENITSSDPMPDISYDVKLLYEALDKLPARMKESIVLFEIEGFSIEEIRDLQGGTISGVKSRLKRGREKLKGLMSDSISKYDIEAQTIQSNGDIIKKVKY